MYGFTRKTWLVISLILAACGQASPQMPPPSPGMSSALPPSEPTVLVIPTLPPVMDVQAIATQQPELVTLRLVQAAPGLAPINIYAGNTLIASNFAYQQATEPTSLAAGQYALRIVPVNSPPDTQPLLETTFTAIKDQPSLLILTDEAGQLSLLTVDDTTSLLNPDETAVTIVHAAPGVNDVRVRQGTIDVTEAVAFGQSATTEALTSGQTTLDLISGGRALLSLPVDLKSRFHYTFVLTGTDTTNLRAIQLSREAPGKATLRAINASTGTLSVDFYLNNQRLATEIGYGRASERQDVPAGNYVVNVYEAGADIETEEPITNQTVSLNPGQMMALVALGSETDTQVLVYPENLDPTPADQARIRFLNTLPTIPIVQVQTGSGVLADMPDLVYNQPPSETIVNAGTISFYMSGGANTVEMAENLQIRPGVSYLYLITGQSDNQPFILSDTVGTIDSTETADTASSDDASTFSAQVRLINAIFDSTPIAFLADNTVLAQALTYGEGSDLLIVESSSPTLSLRAENNNLPSGSRDATLENGGRYTIVAYGPASTPSILVIADSGLIFDGRSPHVRLINVSVEPDSRLGLGFSQANLLPAPPVTVNPETPGDSRLPFPTDGQRLLNGIFGNSASSIILMPTGAFNLFILNSADDEVGAALTNVMFEPGAHYDVIASLGDHSSTVSAFMLEYPIRSE